MISYLLSFYFLTGLNYANSNDSIKKTSRDYLIKRLEAIHKNSNSKDVSKKSITLRLADVLSLRAEERLSKRKDAKCKNCAALGVEDAKKSLSLYKEVNFSIQRKHPALYAHSLFEMAYLHRLMGNTSQSIMHLKKIIKINLRDDFIIRAYFNLGEIYFETYRYKSALQFFNKILKKGENPWVFRSSYRKIWSLYNMSAYNQAVQYLETFLKSDSYERGAATDTEKFLKTKLQKELITLYSHSQLTDQQISFFYHFNKDDDEANSKTARKKRLSDLAKALHRVGRARVSNRVWETFLNQNISLLEKVEAYLSMIDNYLVIDDKNLIKKQGQIIEELFILQKKFSSQFSKELEDRIYKQQKRYIKYLYRYSQKNKEFKTYLFSFYKMYHNVYPNELDTLLKYAFLSKEFKKHELAQNLFQKSSQILSKEIQSNTSAKKTKEEKKDLEQINILQMEQAELSDNQERKNQAYEFYLKNGVNPNILYRVKYQQAYWIYQNKNYEDASRLFKDLALAKIKKPDKKTKELALKSAHLALSSLNSWKNQDDLMAQWSDLFIQKFPNQKKEFAGINHAAIFNLIKQLLFRKDLSSYPIRASKDKKVLKAWKLLNSIQQYRLNQKEKNKYYMNKLLLAKELLKFETMKKVQDQLIKMQASLSAEDYQVVLTWKLWLAETQFNFSEALALVKILNPKAKKTEEYYLRLAHLAELADQDFIPYYQDYLKRYPQSVESFDIVMHIINKSPKKQKKHLLKKYISYFSDKPDQLAYLILELDNQNLNIDFLKSFTQFPFMKNSPISKFLIKKSTIESFHKNSQQILKFSLQPSSSVKKLTLSIKKYKELIAQMEARVKPSIEIKDWLAQVISFSVFHQELVRFYESILKLPLPKGLTPEEQKEYTGLIAAQMTPYKLRADRLSQEIDKLLSKNFIKKYKDIIKQDLVSHGLLKWEITQLQSSPLDSRYKKQLEALLNLIEKSRKTENPVVFPKADTRIQNMYVKLRSQPFNPDHLNGLLKLKQAKEQELMVTYLKNRIKKIKRAKNSRISL